MLFLLCVLAFTTLLCCYAGYIFLVVDRRQQKQLLENPDLYNELDDKEYKFELPDEVEEYEELRLSKPADKCWLPCPELLSLLANRFARVLAHVPVVIPQSSQILSQFSALLLTELRGGLLAAAALTHRRTLPVALLKRAMADIPRIEAR